MRVPERPAPGALTPFPCLAATAASVTPHRRLIVVEAVVEVSVGAGPESWTSAIGALISSSRRSRRSYGAFDGARRRVPSTMSVLVRGISVG